MDYFTTGQKVRTNKRGKRSVVIRRVRGRGNHQQHSHDILKKEI